MQGTRPLGPELSPSPGADRELWRQKLAAIHREDPATDAAGLERLLGDSDLVGDELRDALSTELMRRFRDTSSRASFGLLYELNWGHLYTQVAQRLRRYQSRADPSDLLQEVFFNIYRYPRNFDAGRPEAFRVWTATIVRNTVLKHLRSLGRSGRAEVPFEDLSEQPEAGQGEPLGGVIEQESERHCQRVYLVYLHLYLHFYRQLSRREQIALELVEVDEVSYRDAAEHLAIKLENLKMVIFRARRKIYRAMKRVFEGLPPDFRPARAGGDLKAARPGAVAVIAAPRHPPQDPGSVPAEGAPRVAVSRRPGASVSALARPRVPQRPPPGSSSAPILDSRRNPLNQPTTPTSQPNSCAPQASREDSSR
jgi:RNA polymerase sigma factor (sigma-70 family)